MDRMKLGVAAGVVLLALGCAGAQQSPSPMTFFVTSVGSGKGADLGGLKGADAHCQHLASAAGAGGRTWRAYLSTTAAGGQPPVNARDRIGKGPWRNANGIVIASNVAELHGKNNLTKATALNEKGQPVNGRGDTPNRHDILTGSNPDGTASAQTCENWTSESAATEATSPKAMLGHLDRRGGGAMAESWNAAHASRGCSQDLLKASGGNGYFYCFATGQ